MLLKMSSRKTRVILAVAGVMAIVNAGFGHAQESGNSQVSLPDARGGYSRTDIPAAGGGGSGDDLGNHTATTTLDMSNMSITNLAEPTTPGDAATKNYVDNIFSRLPYRQAGDVSAGIILYTGTNTADRLAGTFDGTTINPGNVSTRMNYNGQFHAGRFYSSMYYYHSDERLKSHVETMEDGMEKVRLLRPVTYRWKSDGRKSMGVIAQEVEKVFPEIVVSSEDGMKSVEYMQMIAPLLSAIQTLDARVQALEAAQK